MAAGYLGGNVGVHLDHVLRPLFDLQLDVVLLLQGSEAAAAGEHPGLAAGRVWRQRAFWEKKKQHRTDELKNNRNRFAQNILLCFFSSWSNVVCSS